MVRKASVGERLESPAGLSAASRTGAFVCYKVFLPTKSIDVALLPTKCGMKNEQGNRRKLATRITVYPNRCRRRIVDLPVAPNRLR